MQTASDIQNKRKQDFFNFCTWVMIGSISLLTLIDLLEKDTREFIADLVILSVLVGGRTAIRLSTMDMAIYRATHFLITLNFFYAVYIGAGEETVLFWTFFMPPLFFFFFGKQEGLLWAVLFFVCIDGIMLMPLLIDGHVYSNVTISRFMIAFPMVTSICYGLESSRHVFGRLLDEKNQLLIREKEQLEKALKEVKTLGGLIPICSNCKKVRNDKGYWEQVETYVRARSKADFSHGICPDCMKIVYPEFCDEL